MKGFLVIHQCSLQVFPFIPCIVRDILVTFGVIIDVNILYTVGKHVMGRYLGRLLVSSLFGLMYGRSCVKNLKSLQDRR